MGIFLNDTQHPKDKGGFGDPEYTGAAMDSQCQLKIADNPVDTSLETGEVGTAERQW